MSELQSIASSARALRASGELFLLATVVRVRGSSYRQAGARMLITDTSWITGSISGGCLEGDIVTRGLWRTRTHPAVVVTYDATPDDERRSGFGLGCDGVVEVLLERFAEEGACDPLAFIERCFDKEQTGALVTVFSSGRTDVPVGARLTFLPSGEEGHPEITTTIGCAALERKLLKLAQSVLAGGLPLAAEVMTEGVGGAISALVEPIRPPPHLFVYGSGHDVVPVVTLAKAVGWNVTVTDQQGRFTTRERFLDARCLVTSSAGLVAAVNKCARPLAVIMSHHYERDRETLAALLGSRALYLGVLGPRRRTERMLGEIGSGGEGPHVRDQGRLHAPVGLHLGGESPHEIALAIVAEAQAELTGSPGGRLREHRHAIHRLPAERSLTVDFK